MPDRIRIAVVDDHPLYSHGVVEALRSNAAFEVVGQGATADQAVRIAGEQLPDVLLLDISLPGGGIEAARIIAARCPLVKVVILTASETEEHVVQALEAGACGYIVKGISADELIATVKGIQLGETYVTPSLAARLLARLSRRKASNENDIAALTSREEDILELVATGQTNKEIARKLGISEKTVKHFMTNIMQKLQVRNRVEAALAAKRRSRQSNESERS